jgi:hypothetical protein
MARKLTAYILYEAVIFAVVQAQTPNINIASPPTPPVATQACVQVTQKLQVPEQIHLVDACQQPPEVRPKLSLLFSESGIDIYRIQGPAAVKPQSGTRLSLYPFSVRALFVFQDEQERQHQVQSMISAGEAVNWIRGGYRYDSTLPADWTPALNIKYATYTYTIFNSSSAYLIEAHMYAPVECYSYGTRCVNANYLAWESAPNFGSSEIANFYNRSPSNALPQDSLAYRVAMMLAKLRLEEETPPQPQPLKPTQKSP